MLKYSLLVCVCSFFVSPSWCQEAEQELQVLFHTGDSLMESHITFDALKCYQRAFELKDCALTRMKLADCYYQRVAYKQATDLLKVLHEDSLTHEAYRQLVFGFHKLSDASAMTYWAEQGVWRFPMDADLVAKLASGFQQLNQPRNGIECSLKYLQTDSTNIEVNRALENSYFCDLQFDEAAAVGERLLALGDSVFNTLFLTGLSYSKLDSLEQSYAILLKAATVNGFKNEVCLRRLGTACLKMERYEEGLEYLEKAKDLIYPDTMVMRSLTLSLAEANYMSERPQEAIEAWKLHLAYNPKTLTTYYNIANAYAFMLENRDEAKLYYMQFLERARAEESPTDQLLKMIERAENMIRELPEDEQEKPDMPAPELKQDSLRNEELPADSIRMEP